MADEWAQWDHSPGGAMVFCDRVDELFPGDFPTGEWRRWARMGVEHRIEVFFKNGGAK